MAGFKKDVGGISCLLECNGVEQAIMTSIYEYLCMDQQYILNLWSKVQKVVAMDSWNEARAILAAMIRALHLHIEAEEEILFPVCEENMGWVADPVFFMCFEHRQIGYQLKQLKIFADADEHAEFVDLADSLTNLLDLHNAREAMEIYPVFDRMPGIKRNRFLREIRGKVGLSA